MSLFKKVLTVFIILAIVVITIFGLKDCINEGINAVSVSSDGKYAVTTGPTKTILWDIENKSHKIMSENANMLSAYFIKGTYYFAWQDKNNVVHLHHVNGDKIKYFRLPEQIESNFFTKDLTKYVYTNHGWQIKYLNLDDEILNQFNVRYSPDISILRLHLSGNGKYFITAGNGYDALHGLMLWDAKTMQPIRKLNGNSGKLAADINYDGSRVISLDESGDLIVFNAEIGEIIRKEHLSNVGNVKYITRDEYKLFLKKPMLKQYPKVISGDYRTYQTTDAAPEVGIVVQAKLRGNGIVVSKDAGYGLKRVWVSGGRFAWWIDTLAEVNWNAREFIDNLAFFIHYCGWVLSFMIIGVGLVALVFVYCCIKGVIRFFKVAFS